MERIYFAINEESAKLSKEMMSFSDYKMGSQTAAYKSDVDKLYELAEKVIEARPDEQERIEKLATRYARNLATYYNKDAAIGGMCPSVMISGGSNFPVRKKERQNAAWEKNMQYFQEISKIKEKLISIMHGKEIIKSGDADAVEKLKKKIDTLQKYQDTMKKINAYYRKNKTLEGCDLLPAEEMMKVKKSMAGSWRGEPKPFESYELTNNNANIRRYKERLKALEEEKEKEPLEVKSDFCEVVENTEMMRLQLLFPDKPSEEIRTILKSNGFRWAPSQQAWQRQLNQNGRYALERVMKELEEM